MADLVPADQIEQIVGAKRHPVLHLGRAVDAEQTVYILHSRLCRDSGIDLRDCVFSRALDYGIDEHGAWNGQHDRAVVLTLIGPYLRPSITTDLERAGAKLLEREP